MLKFNGIPRNSFICGPPAVLSEGLKQVQLETTPRFVSKCIGVGLDTEKPVTQIISEGLLTNYSVQWGSGGAPVAKGHLALGTQQLQVPPGPPCRTGSGPQCASC